MSLCVGLGTSEADLDVQGEIDFDFFEESDCSSDVNKTTATQEKSTLLSSNNRSVGPNYSPKSGVNLKECDLNVTNVLESSCSQYFNKPVITVSCDDVTGLIQKTTIETIIPTPFNYKDNKCGKASPNVSRKGKKMLSPRLKSKVFSDDYEISDDSSLSSMSESESDLSSVSGDSVDLNEESDSMTDVTPLMSPYQCSSPMPEKLSLCKGKSRECLSGDVKKEGVKFSDNLENSECSKCKAIDITELLKAVKRLEVGQNINPVSREKSATPSVTTQNLRCRKNLSFSNEEVRRIDNDNQVLLKKIVAQQNRIKPRSNTALQHRVVSSASVNRQRHQRQIELENLALLKRLESTKASKDLRRSHLLRDYESRSAGVLSRTSSRASKSGSSRTSTNSSGRSSAISNKSAALSSRTIKSSNF